MSCVTLRFLGEHHEHQLRHLFDFSSSRENTMSILQQQGEQDPDLSTERLTVFRGIPLKPMSVRLSLRKEERQADIRKAEGRKV